MTIEKKVTALENAMQKSKRKDDTEFYHFSDNAPKELKDIFMEHYEVRDIDYEIFSQAIDTVREAWENNEESPTLLRDYIEENYSEFSSVYTSDLLGYLTIWNHEEVADNMKELGCSIPEACAYWYDNEVKNACLVIVDDYLMTA